MNKPPKGLQAYNIDIKSSDNIDSGINSNVYRIADNKGMKYVLKLYKKQCLSDKRMRRRDEESFYKYLTKCNVTCTPKLIATSEKDNYSIFSYVEGVKIKNPDINDIQQISEFILEINKPINRRKYSNILPHASDAYKFSLSPAVELERRIKKQVGLYAKNNKTKNYLNNWIKDILIQSSKKAIKEYKEKLDERIWTKDNAAIYISPSDIGFHNVIKSRYGKLYFIDFEYAGRDDISKLIADLTCNPNHIFTECEESRLLEKLSINTTSQCAGNKTWDKYWLDRYKSVKPLVKLKWCFIMINKINNESIELKDEIITESEKVISYFEESHSDNIS